MSTSSRDLISGKTTYSIIGAFFKVHHELGYGFVEHVYSEALAFELRKRGHRVGREVRVGIYYDGVEITHQRLDMLVDDEVVVELKAGDKLPAGACRKLFNYLKATDLQVGMLLHFTRDAQFYRVVCEQTSKKRPSGPKGP